MAWIYLAFAGVFEVVWATTLKLSDGFSKLNYTALTIVGMGLSFWLLSQATKTLPLSTAYPIWTGIGAVGAVIVGYIYFGDQIAPMTWIFIALLLISILGIKMTSGH